MYFSSHDYDYDYHHLHSQYYCCCRRCCCCVATLSILFVSRRLYTDAKEKVASCERKREVHDEKVKRLSELRSELDKFRQQVRSKEQRVLVFLATLATANIPPPRAPSVATAAAAAAATPTSIRKVRQVCELSQFVWYAWHVCLATRVYRPRGVAG